MMDGRMLAIQALSPIHVGAGQGAGVIDLPVIREATTGWPYLPGSSIKGVLRDVCAYAAEALFTGDPARKVIAEQVKAVFGPATTEDPGEHAGGIIVGDQHLLCLAVRSWHGGFAWVTCPFAINRWLRDARAIGQPVRMAGGAAELAECDADPGASEVVLSQTTKLTPDTRVLIEDLELKKHATADASAYAEAIGKRIAPVGGLAFFTQRFAIVSDTTFGFLTRTAMDVVARNSIDEARKIVKTGALWWEESVPAESIFVGPIVATPQGANRMPARGKETGAGAMFDFVSDQVKGKTLQIGGNATVGRGLAVARLAGDEQ